MAQLLECIGKYWEIPVKIQIIFYNVDHTFQEKKIYQTGKSQLFLNNWLVK